MEYLTYLPPAEGETTGDWMDEDGALIEASLHVTPRGSVILHIPDQLRDYSCEGFPPDEEGAVRWVEGGWYIVREAETDNHLVPNMATWTVEDLELDRPPTNLIKVAERSLPVQSTHDWQRNGF